MRQILVFLSLVAVLLAASPATAAGPIRIMLLDGVSGGQYHNWQ